MAVDRRRDRACAETVRSIVRRDGTGTAKTRAAAVSARTRPCWRRSLPRDRGIDRRRLQRGAAAGLGQRRRRRGRVRQAAGRRTHAGRHAAEFAGRICLAEGRRSYRHALCSPERGRAGRGLDAVRCAGKTRRRPRRQEPHRRCQRQRAGIFRKARLRRQTAQHRDRQRRMARQHHDAEDADSVQRREIPHEPRTPLSVRHHAARRRADQRRRFHAA